MESVEKEENWSFVVFQALISGSRSFIIIDCWWWEKAKGGESRGREYQYEFFIWWVFMGDCISEGWQSQGSWKSERRERPSHKGQVRNNGVPAREEHTLTLLFTTYTIPHYVCIKNCNSKEHSASLFLSFCLKLKTSWCISYLLFL